MSDPEITVADNPAQNRYDVVVDGRPAGFASYRLQADGVVFTHTQVASEFEGGGVGSALARVALDDARAKSRRVVPLCPFIAEFIDRHAEYQDLVDTD